MKDNLKLDSPCKNSLRFLSPIHYNVSEMSEGFHRTVRAVSVVGFSIIKTDCTSKDKADFD